MPIPAASKRSFTSSVKPKVTGQKSPVATHTRNDRLTELPQPGDEYHRFGIAQNTLILRDLQQDLPCQLDVRAVVDTDVDVGTTPRLAGVVGDMPVGQSTVGHHDGLVVGGLEHRMEDLNRIDGACYAMGFLSLIHI